MKSAKPDIGLLLTYIGQLESLAGRATVANPRLKVTVSGHCCQAD